MMPRVLALANWLVATFLTTPRRVPKNRNVSSVKPLRSTTVVISSFAPMARRLLRCAPRAAREASGISWTFCQYALPALEMYMR